MRDVSASVLNAINDSASYRALAKARVYPSMVFFDAITSNYPVSGADAVPGLLDDPLPQDIGYSPNGYAVTFYNHSGTLYYAVQGNASGISTMIAITGKPGVCGSTIYFIQNGSVQRSTINWANVHSRSSAILSGTTNLGAPGTGAPLHVHGVSSTQCSTICDNDGGLRVTVYSGGWKIQPGRFMFPKFVDYTDGGAERSMSSLGLCSGALLLEGKIITYISNNERGSVEAVAFDTVPGAFGDIYTAVPTDLVNSLCEFRVANAFSRNGSAYLVGQFYRSEAVEGSDVYSMILYSTNGHTFAIDRFALVSDIGYRFQAISGDDGKLYLSNGNRVCYAPNTYIFDGTGAYIDIPADKIISFSDNSGTQGNMTIASSDEELMFHPYLAPGSKVEVSIGYKTSAGDEYVPYGAYIIDEIHRSVSDGSRGMNLVLVNESTWKLSGLSSPFYVEIAGKSSVYDHIEKDGANFYVAHNMHHPEDRLSIDFWDCEPYENASLGINGLNILEDGGVDVYEDGAYHKWGIISKEIKTKMTLDDNPILTGGPVVHIHGWSHAVSGSVNDKIRLILIVKDDEGNESLIYDESPAYHWPNYYPEYADGKPYGDDVIMYTVDPGSHIGKRLTKVGLVFDGADATFFCPARVEILSGIDFTSPFNDVNTGWEVTDEGEFRLPGQNRPYIMFAQKPYDARNFKIAARFVDTHTGFQNTDYYKVGPGLVGLAEDGQNYILARYNRCTSQIELRRVRNNREWYLAAADVEPLSVIDMMFEHKDGTFKVYLKSDGVYKERLSYEWSAHMGWMYTSKTVSPKCGIYGIAASPWFRIIGYDPGKQENIVNADGIGVLPSTEYQFAYFPASGQVKIGQNVYSYSRKIDVPDPIRGPYQYRQSAQYGDQYGMEVRDFQYGAAADLVAGKLLAIDDGAAYEITASEFNEATTRERTRHYSANKQISTAFHTLANRCYVTGGIAGLTRISGQEASHAWGSACAVYLPGELKCTYFEGASGEQDTTIRDLIDYISRNAGAEAAFPGDVAHSSIGMSGNLVATLEYPQGIDIHFRLASTPSSCEVTTNIPIEDERISGSTGSSVRVTHMGSGKFQASLLSGSTVVQSTEFYAGTGQHILRVLYHDNFASLYMDGQWIYTFGVEKMSYPASCTVRLNGGGTAYDVRLTELSDWREAIFIDLETDAKSAITSVIQERPIEIYSKSNGSIAYYYSCTHSLVTQTNEPRNHAWSQASPRDCASDAIIYSAQEVKAIQFPEFSHTHGFSTKILRLPNLYTGANRAAKVLLKKLLNKSKTHNLQIRPDVRIEAGDKLSFDYTASGTGRHITGSIIVEGVKLDLNDRGSQMTINGMEEIV